jgi:hypothetical protein
MTYAAQVRLRNNDQLKLLAESTESSALGHSRKESYA